MLVPASVVKNGAEIDALMEESLARVAKGSW